MKPFIPKRPGFCIILYFLLIHMRLALPNSKTNMRIKQLLIILFSCSFFFNVTGQDSTGSTNPALLIYRGSFPHINDLVHTKLDTRFDYTRSYMYGKAWITCKPHFYPTDSLSLDAKGMDIKEVSVIKGNQRSPLKYNYDGSTLNIHLDKTYSNTENYTIYI